MEPGLLGASSFPEPVVLLGPLGEALSLAGAGGAAWVVRRGLVFPFGRPFRRLTELVGPEPDPVVVVVELGPVLLPGPVGPEPLVAVLA